MGDDTIEAGGLLFKRTETSIRVLQSIDFGGKAVLSEIAGIPLARWDRLVSLLAPVVELDKEQQA